MCLTATASMPFLRQLEPVAERLLDRHQSIGNSVDTHEYVPWGLSRDFDVEP